MLTLMEWAKLNPDVLQSGVVEIISSVNPVLERMPFENIAGAALVWNIEKTLPGVAFRGINQPFPESTGVLQQQKEALKIAGGDSDFDNFLLATGTGDSESRATHVNMKSKSLSLNWMKNFFDGDEEADPIEFDGLNKRLIGNQLLGTDGGLTLTLDLLDDLLDAVIGSPSALYMSKTMRRKTTKLAQSTSNVTFGLDALGRKITEYAGIPIGVIEEDETGTEILGFDEAENVDGSGATDTTSIYAVSYGPDRVHGIQNAPVSVRDLGESHTTPAERTRIEWFASFVAKHGKSAARLSRINDA